jgi:hypothetical protein
VAVKKVPRYLKGTIEFDIYFVKSSFIKLVFSNCDWVESDNVMMSISGYCFAIEGSIFC